jgi:integrase
MATKAPRAAENGVKEKTKDGVTARPTANGTIKYKAQVRIKKDGKITHQETKTFSQRATAVAWRKQREVELAKPDGMAAAKATDPTLSKAIEDYLNDPARRQARDNDAKREITTSKRQALALIAKSKLGDLKCSHVTARALVHYFENLTSAKGERLAPATIASYTSHLKSVFKVTKTKRGYPLKMSEFREALDTLGDDKVTGTSESRDRRPTLDEVTRIVEHMYTKWLNNPRMAPYHLIVLFAIFSTRRQSEITRMKWEDIDSDACRLLVLNMKDPKKKQGNHVFVDLTFEALRVVRAAREHARVAGRAGDVVFPYSGNAISTEFKETCQALEIEDLRFHDLRHEGVSRLFELGFDIPKVAAMSGHKTWVHLKRYAHIHKYGDKYAGWPFLDLAAPLPQRAA